MLFQEEVPAQLDKLISAPVDEHPYLKPFKDNKTVSDEDLWVAFTNIRFVMGCQRWYNSNCNITIQKASFTLKICHSMMLKMASWLTGPTHIYISENIHRHKCLHAYIYFFWYMHILSWWCLYNWMEISFLWLLSFYILLMFACISKVFLVLF